MDLDTINRLDQRAFVAAFGAVFEHSPWVAESAWRERPYASVAALHGAMVNAVRAAPSAQQLALLRAHPELAGSEAVAGALTVDSTGEQGRLGFTALSHAEFESMGELNRRYREKFGFPCIIALKLHTNRGTVTADFTRRLANDVDTEMKNALEQIGHITRARLDKLVNGG